MTRPQLVYVSSKRDIGISLQSIHIIMKAEGGIGKLACRFLLEQQEHEHVFCS